MYLIHLGAFPVSTRLLQKLLHFLLKTLQQIYTIFMIFQVISVFLRGCGAIVKRPINRFTGQTAGQIVPQSKGDWLLWGQKVLLHIQF